MDPKKLPPAVLIALGLQACTDKVSPQPCLSIAVDDTSADDSSADDSGADDSGTAAASRAAVLERVEARLPADVAAKLRR